MKITLNKAQVDWITLTSFEPKVYENAQEVVKKIGLDQEMKKAKRLQYSGFSMGTRTGNIFMGRASQRGQLHYMTQTSGELAHDAFSTLTAGFEGEFLRCSRLDIQTTILQPKAWSQWRLFNRLKKAGNIVGWIESKTDGIELATVYCGSRKNSPRMFRVYQKLTEDRTVLLRLEVELKRGRGHAVAKAMYKGDHDAIMLSELQEASQKDPQLERLFYNVIGNAPRPVQVESSEPKTERWILNTCLPTIDSYLKSSENTHTVIALMKAIIARNGS